MGYSHLHGVTKIAQLLRDSFNPGLPTVDIYSHKVNLIFVGRPGACEADVIQPNLFSCPVYLFTLNRIGDQLTN